MKETANPALLALSLSLSLRLLCTSSDVLRFRSRIAPMFESLTPLSLKRVPSKRKGSKEKSKGRSGLMHGMVVGTQPKAAPESAYGAATFSSFVLLSCHLPLLPCSSAPLLPSPPPLSLTHLFDPSGAWDPLRLRASNQQTSTTTTTPNDLASPPLSLHSFLFSFHYPRSHHKPDRKLAAGSSQRKVSRCGCCLPASKW